MVLSALSSDPPCLLGSILYIDFPLRSLNVRKIRINNRTATSQTSKYTMSDAKESPFPATCRGSLAVSNLALKPPQSDPLKQPITHESSKTYTGFDSDSYYDSDDDSCGSDWDSSSFKSESDSEEDGLNITVTQSSAGRQSHTVMDLASLTVILNQSQTHMDTSSRSTAKPLEGMSLKDREAYMPLFQISNHACSSPIISTFRTSSLNLRLAVLPAMILKKYCKRYSKRFHLERSAGKNIFFR